MHSKLVGVHTNFGKSWNLKLEISSPWNRPQSQKVLEFKLASPRISVNLPSIWTTKSVHSSAVQTDSAVQCNLVYLQYKRFIVYGGICRVWSWENPWKVVSTDRRSYKRNFFVRILYNGVTWFYLLMTTSTLQRFRIDNALIAHCTRVADEKAINQSNNDK